MPKHFIYIFGGAIGDALLGVQLAHTLEKAYPTSRLTLISTRKSSFVRQVLELVPQVEYMELLHDDIYSWFSLLKFVFSAHGVAFLEPFRDPPPFWWKIIARMATLFPGGIEIRCQSHPQKVPARVCVILYDPRTDNLFSMISRVVPLWVGHSVSILTPFLPVQVCLQGPKNAYILFHFFAGTYRRSFPIEKVRPLLAVAREKFPSHEFILTCAHQEESAAREMISGISDARVKVSPHARDLMCLLKQSAVCVGVASGITHIASHLEVPSVVMCNLSDPCWLPTYAKNTVLLSAREHCGCNGNKTGECGAKTQEGIVYRCLYDIKTESIITEMSRLVVQKS